MLDDHSFSLQSDIFRWFIKLVISPLLRRQLILQTISKPGIIEIALSYLRISIYLIIDQVFVHHNKMIYRAFATFLIDYYQISGLVLRATWVHPFEKVIFIIFRFFNLWFISVEREKLGPFIVELLSNSLNSPEPSKTLKDNVDSVNPASDRADHHFLLAMWKHLLEQNRNKPLDTW